MSDAPELPFLEEGPSSANPKRPGGSDKPSGSQSKKAKSKSVVKVEPKSMHPLPRRRTRSSHQIRITDSTPHLIDEDSDGSVSPLVSASDHVPNLPSLVTPHILPSSDPLHAAGDEDMVEAEDTGDAPPAFLARYEENRRFVLARDRKYPEIKKKCTWTPHDARFVTPAAAKRYSSIPLGVSKTLTEQLVESVRLLSSNVEVDSYVEEVVKEIYDNLGDIKIRGCGRHCVFVRGTMYEFTPRNIVGKT